MKSPFQTLLTMHNARIKNGKNPLPIEILRAFQADRKAIGERVLKAVENGIIKQLEKGA